MTVQTPAPQRFCDLRPGPCLGCTVRHRALCAALDDQEIGALESIVSDVSYGPKQSLFFQDDASRHVYTIRSGTVMQFRLLADGRRQVLSFHGPGKLIGVSDTDVQAFGAEAVTPVTACEIPSAGLAALKSRFPNLDQKLRDILTADLRTAQSMLVTLGRKTAKERIASFLAHRLDDTPGAQVPGHDLQKPAIDLPMGRAEIADHVGLTSETVSRVLSDLVRDGTISIPRTDRVVVERLDALTALADA